MTDCYKGFPFEAGNVVGACCCNCVHQKTVAGHPWNKGHFHGRVSDAIGYACALPDQPHIVLFEREHSLCEMHQFKEMKSA